MTKHTAEDYASAEFARHENGRIATRVDPDDDFTEAARAEALSDRQYGKVRDERDRKLMAGAFIIGAEWGREHALAQESDAERAVRDLHRPVDVEPSDTICAACSTLRGSGESLRYFPTEEWPCATIQALDMARAARRDEEKQDG